MPAPKMIHVVTWQNDDGEAEIILFDNEPAADKFAAYVEENSDFDVEALCLPLHTSFKSAHEIVSQFLESEDDED